MTTPDPPNAGAIPTHAAVAPTPDPPGSDPDAAPTSSTRPRSADPDPGPGSGARADGGPGRHHRRRDRRGSAARDPAAPQTGPQVGPQVGPASAPKAANIPFAAPPVPALPVDPITDYSDDGVPTFSYVQDNKVEKALRDRAGRLHELADATIPEVQRAAKRREELAKSAEERLAEIRRSLHPDG